MILKRLNIPLLFFLAIIAVIVFKSLTGGVAVTVAYLFYMASLPEEDTRRHAILLPVSFVLIAILILMDEGAKGFIEMTTVGFLAISLAYTFGSFCILSPLIMVPFTNFMRYTIIFGIACMFALVSQKPSEGNLHLIENTGLYFIYLSGVYGLSALLWRKKMQPKPSF